METGHPTLSLLICDRLRQRSNHRRKNMAVHQFLASLSLVMIRLDKCLAPMAAPILAHREINAYRRLREMAGADLVRVGTRFHVEPTLEPASVVERNHQRGFIIQHLSPRHLNKGL